MHQMLSHTAQWQIVEMLTEQDEDSKPEMSILQLGTISNEDRQKYVWRQDLHKHTEQHHEYQSLKEVILKDSCITKKHCHIILASSPSPYAEQRPYYLWVHLIIPTRMCKEILSQLHETH